MGKFIKNTLISAFILSALEGCDNTPDYGYVEGKRYEPLVKDAYWIIDYTLIPITSTSIVSDGNGGFTTTTTTDLQMTPTGGHREDDDEDFVLTVIKTDKDGNPLLDENGKKQYIEFETTENRFNNLNKGSFFCKVDTCDSERN